LKKLENELLALELMYEKQNKKMIELQVDYNEMVHNYNKIATGYNNLHERVEELEDGMNRVSFKSELNKRTLLAFGGKDNHTPQFAMDKEKEELLKKW